MVKFISTAAIISAACLLSACSTAEPGAGQEAVWVKKPYVFGSGGVDPDPVSTGREYGAMSSTAINVDILPQRIDMDFDDMMTHSGVPVSFHVVATYRIVDTVKLVSKFGADVSEDGTYNFWYRNLDQPIRTAVRDAVKKRDMQEMAISQTAADAVGREVEVAANAIVKKTGVPIIITSINVGRVNPPDAIKTQRIKTAEQQQRVITENDRKLAEDARMAAETSRAAADNAYREAMKLSPDQFLQLEAIKMQGRVCGGENKNCTIFMGGSGPSPVYDVRRQ